MKRLNFLCSFLLFAFALSFCGVSVYAQTKSQIKEAKKEAKSEAKKLTKEGWELIGIGSLESAIYEAILKTKTGYSEYSFSLNGYSSQGQALKMARAQVYEAYAQSVATDLETIIEVNSVGIPAAQVEQAVNNLTNFSKASVYGQLKEAYTISREVNGLYEVRSNYLISDSDKYDAQLKALRRAISVAKLNKEVAEAMEETLKQGFEDVLEDDAAED